MFSPMLNSFSPITWSKSIAQGGNELPQSIQGWLFNSFSQSRLTLVRALRHPSILLFALMNYLV